MESSKIIDKISQAIESKTESSQIEFKDARSGIPGDLWRAVTAFSNSPGGGLIVFGVKEKTTVPRKISVVGNLDLATLQEKIISLMEHKIINNAPYLVEIVEYQGKKLLALILQETDKENKPCYNKDLGMHRGACVRVGNTNQVISEEQLRSFLRYATAYNYDIKAIKNLSLEDLSDSKINNFLKHSASKRGRTYPKDQPTEKVLENLGIITKVDEELFPTLAGLLIFLAEEPQQYEALSRYIVRCVSYAGKSATSEIVDQFDIHGTLDNQVDETLKFILRNIRLKAKIVGSKREEYPEFPELALREVVVNALIHRDYSNTGTYVQVVVYKDRVEVSNPGTLPPGVTVENLKVSQFSRNGVIARIMRDMDYMEEFGRGIDLIYAQMSKAGLVAPLFKNAANTFKVTLLGEEYLDLNERQLKFWHILQDKNHLTASIAAEIFPTVSRATINSDLRGLVDIGMVRMKGSSSNTYYEPEY